MAKPKITRLGDPRNPYTKKKVTPAMQAESYKAAGARGVIPGYTPPAPKTKAKKTKTSEPTGPLGRARKDALDRQIRRAGG